MATCGHGPYVYLPQSVYGRCDPGDQSTHSSPGHTAPDVELPGPCWGLWRHSDAALMVTGQSSANRAGDHWRPDLVEAPPSSYRTRAGQPRVSPASPQATAWSITAAAARAERRCGLIRQVA